MKIRTKLTLLASGLVISLLGLTGILQIFFERATLLREQEARQTDVVRHLGRVCQDAILDKNGMALLNYVRTVWSSEPIVHVILVDIEGKLDTFERLGPIKTSMLQDFEAGKTIELDALLGVIIELGKKAGIETPVCDLVYTLTRMKAVTAGCYAPPGG